MNNSVSNTSTGTADPTPTPRSISVFDLKKTDAAGAEKRNLLGNGFLRRGQVGLVVGATGTGKSVLVMQGALNWSIGRAFFGIEPQRALKVLIIQAENDDDDMADMRDGLLAGDSLTPDELALASVNLRTLRSLQQGPGLFADIRADVIEYKPDVIILDPLFAYAGVDVAKDQPGLSEFLRGFLLQFCLDHNLGVVLVHHTNRPPTAGKGSPQWRAGDFAYAGSGHNEIANFCRFVCVLRPLGSTEVYEFRLAKRWKRANVRASDGSLCDHFLIKHSAAGVHWAPATDEDLKVSISEATRTKRVATLEERIAGAFSAIQQNRKATVVDLAAFMKMSDRNVRRPFSNGRPVEFGKLVLKLGAGVVYQTIAE